VWGEYNNHYLRSAYYHDYIVPGRYFDAVGITHHLAGPGVQPGPGTTAGVWLHRDRQERLWLSPPLHRGEANICRRLLAGRRDL